jgi:AcrR family transcriptional regulator
VPRAGLSADIVVAEAAKLVDEVGPDRLTLAALAKRFGVAQPSLYKHVDGLDSVHRRLAVLTANELSDAMRKVATGKAGADVLRAIAGAYRDYARDHPGRYAYVLRAPSADDTELAEAATNLLSIFYAVFAGYRITGEDAVDAARFVRSGLHGFVSLELCGGFGIPQSVDRSFERLVDALDKALTDW